jgi:hypothetical protein
MYDILVKKKHYCRTIFIFKLLLENFYHAKSYFDKFKGIIINYTRDAGKGSSYGLLPGWGHRHY